MVRLAGLAMASVGIENRTQAFVLARQALFFPGATGATFTMGILLEILIWISEVLII